ncbi:MAG: chromosome partitioning protein ParB, partial [Desulfobulbus sp.]|nr:chromosome partitioning protein ParB [Desulfobulbus sp.]
RATERICSQQPQSGAPSGNRTRGSSAEELPKSYCTALINQLSNQLHTKVRIVQQGKRGRLEIEYYSSDDLDRLVSLLSS